MNALMMAAHANAAELADVMLAAAPALLNAREKGARPVLHWAADKGHANMIARLRALPGARRRAAPAVPLLRSATRRPSLFGAARHAGRPSLAQRGASTAPPPPPPVAVKAGANVNIADDDGFTALHRAAGSGHADATAALLAAGAAADARSRARFTPLMLAAERGHAACARALVAAGADVVAANDIGFTPVKLARVAGHFALAFEMAKHAPPPPPLAE